MHSNARKISSGTCLKRLQHSKRNTAAETKTHHNAHKVFQQIFFLNIFPIILVRYVRPFQHYAVLFDATELLAHSQYAENRVKRK